MTDHRVQALRDFVTNLQDCPADQDDSVLAEASNLTAQLRGLIEAERLHRALHVDSPTNH